MNGPWFYAEPAASRHSKNPATSAAIPARMAGVTLGHEERLDDLLAGYGAGADRDVIRAWWSLRSLVVSHWLIEHGFDPDTPGAEFDVLRSRMQEP